MRLASPRPDGGRRQIVRVSVHVIGNVERRNTRHGHEARDVRAIRFEHVLDVSGRLRPVARLLVVAEHESRRRRPHVLGRPMPPRKELVHVPRGDKGRHHVAECLQQFRPWLRIDEAPTDDVLVRRHVEQRLVDEQRHWNGPGRGDRLGHEAELIRRTRKTAAEDLRVDRHDAPAAGLEAPMVGAEAGQVLGAPLLAHDRMAGRHRCVRTLAEIVIAGDEANRRRNLVVQAARRGEVVRVGRAVERHVPAVDDEIGPRTVHVRRDRPEARGEVSRPSVQMRVRDLYDAETHAHDGRHAP